MVSFAQVRLGKQRVDAHFRHDPTRPLLVDENPVIAPQDGCDRPVAPSRFVGVNPVDNTANLDLLIADQL